jgi:thiamine monophosphate synthase
MTSIVSGQSAPAESSEALMTLAKYLELSLDAGASLVMLRKSHDQCDVYVGDPAEAPNELKHQGTVSIILADEILVATRAGQNQVSIEDRTYRFLRTFTHIQSSGAVIFTPQ